MLACFFHANLPTLLHAADNPQGKEISDVVIVGNKKHTSKQIQSLLHTKVGKTYDAETIQEDVRRLYHTKWFAPGGGGIQLYTQTGSDGRLTVIFKVCELLNTVKEIVYEGADHLSKSELQELTGLNKGDPMNPLTNDVGRRAILLRYQEDGRYFASVELVEGSKHTDTRVVYRIVEGPVVKIGAIEFVGNESVPAHRLRLHVTRGKLTADNLASNRQSLEAYYGTLGFPGAQIVWEVEVRRVGDTNVVTVVYYITEGTHK
jgi:outer membrane protein assembly factor BamA